MKKPRGASKASVVPDVNPFDAFTYCSDCDYEGSISVASEFSSSAKVMLIGDFPRDMEIKHGRNFVGDSGRLLTRYLRTIGKNRRDLNLGNIIRCQLDNAANKNADTRKKVVAKLSVNCGKYIHWEILKHKPKIVILAGLPAIHYFLKGDPSILSVRGKVYYSKEMETHYICTYHPANVMHDWSVEKLLIKDLERAFEFAEDRVVVKEAKYKICRSLDESLSACEFLRNQKEIVFDVETDSLDWLEGEVLSFGFSHKPHTGITIPFTSIHSTPLTKKERLKLISYGLKPLLESDIGKIGQNISFDCHWALNHGMYVKNITFDTMQAQHLVDENFPLKLDYLADYYTDMGVYADALKPYLTSKKCSYNVIPDEILWLYGAKDCDAEFRVKEALVPKLKQEGLLWLFENIVVPLIPTLFDVERRGVCVDREGFARESALAAEELDKMYLKMQAFSGMGDDFNPNSPQQMQEILFEVLGLPKGRKTKTGYSTDAKTLEKLKYEHEFVELLLSHRKLAKFKGTYLDGGKKKNGKETGLVRRIRANGRIYTSYKIHGTRTGRLSSENPNLQNIPRGTTSRSLFVAAEGYKFVIADFERGELYSAAHLSRDINLKRVLAREDVHRVLAAGINNIKPSEVTKEQRIIAKTVVFGILYGRGPDSIANSLGIDRREAVQYIVAFFNSYPQLEDWIKRTHGHLTQYGYVRNLFGRRRHLYGVFSTTDKYKKAEMYRQAQNMPISGSLADAGHLATIELHRKLKKAPYDAGIVLLVHDEVVVETPIPQIEEVSNLILDIFQTPRKGLKIPVEVLIGDNWSAK